MRGGKRGARVFWKQERGENSFSEKEKEVKSFFWRKKRGKGNKKGGSGFSSLSKYPKPGQGTP